MAALRAYLDDSGSRSAVSVAGYIGPERAWEVFEPLWAEALDRHDIPYFHMREIRDPKSPMHKFCASEGAAAREALFIDLIRAISKCWVPGLHGIAAVVSTAALSRFNQERRRNIDAVSFALFNCLHMKDPNLRQSLIELGGATQITTAVWTYEALCAQDDERDGRWTIKLECCAGGQEAQAKTLTQQGLKGG